MLALKRHEVAPPGFFDRLPGQIRAGIQAEAAAVDRPWWDRWQTAFAWRPALAGVCALGVVSLIVWRAVHSQPTSHYPASLLAQDQVPARLVYPAPLQPAPALTLSAYPFDSETDGERPSVSPFVNRPPPEGLFRPRIGKGLLLPAYAPHGPTNGPVR